MNNPEMAGNAGGRLSSVSASASAVVGALVLSAVIDGGVTRLASATDFRIGDRILSVPEGFTVELAADVSLVERPIVADFDEEGRLYVAESSGSNAPVEQQLEERPHRILRLEDRDGDGMFDDRVVFADRMMFPEGVLWHDGSVYVGAPPHIWKLTDRDDDGVCDEREIWFDGKTLTGCANDIHGPYLGRDGWIYWCKGAFAEQTYDRPGRAPLVTRAAHVFRRHPRTGVVEPVMTGGMDNPVDVVFSESGERFLTATFVQHPGGGRRDGIIHAVQGGVWGKDHGVIEGHVRTGDLMPVLSHLGPAAPSGLEFYDATTFGEAFRGNLFAAQFNLRRVSRHVLVPDGATFRSEDSDFLVADDVDFHPTDVVEDADGSLLVVDTGGWYKICCPTSQFHKPDVPGALYRVRRIADAEAVPPAAVPPAADPRGAAIDWDELDAGELASLLDDRDRSAVRARALASLTRRGAEQGIVSALSDRLRQTAGPSTVPPQGRVETGWALIRIGSPEALAALRHGLADPDTKVRQVAAHGAALWQDADAAPALASLLDAGSSPPEMRVAAEALGRIAARAAIEPLLDAAGGMMAPAGSTRFLEHSIIHALVEIGIADPAARGDLAAGLAASAPMTRRAALIALDQCQDEAGLDVAALAAALEDQDAVVREAAWWIVEGRGGPAGLVAGAVRDHFARRGPDGIPEAADSPDPDWVRRLSRFSGDPVIAGILAEALADPDLPAGLRLTALRAMESAGSGSPWAAEWEHAAANALREGDGAPSPAVLAALARRGVPARAEALRAALLDVVRDPEREADHRALALAAVTEVDAVLDAAETEVMMDALRGARRLEARRAAVAVAGRAALSPQTREAVARQAPACAPGDLPAITTALARHHDEAVGLLLVEILAADARDTLVWSGREAMEEAFRGFPDPVQAEFRERIAPLLDPPDAAAAAAEIASLTESLPPGDVRRGQDVFHSDRAACLTCHAIGYVGGDLGPDLTRVGAVRSRSDLLEAILHPSASFVRSYESALLTLVDGGSRLGILRSEDADGILLAVAPGLTERLPAEAVSDRRAAPVSLMPAGLRAVLTDAELADLLAFLQACR